MRGREQVIWDFVQNWLKKASEDLKAAEHLIKTEWDDYFNTAFHSQRSAEKYIKAYRVRNQIEFHKIHNLQELINLIKEKDSTLASKLNFAIWLTDFAVEFRYPAAEPVTKETAEKALSDAQCIKDIILDALKEYLSKGRSSGAEK